MSGPKLLDELNAKLKQAIDSSPAKDIEKNVRAVMTSVFSRLDLVTREEFDVQREVLLRTRERLVELERQVAELEARARQIVARFPDHALTLYGEQLQKRIARAEQNGSAGLPPEEVAAVILKALTARRPQTRYQVGNDAKIVVNLIACLPDRWRDWLVARQR